MKIEVDMFLFPKPMKSKPKLEAREDKAEASQSVQWANRMMICILLPTLNS